MTSSTDNETKWRSVALKLAGGVILTHLLLLLLFAVAPNVLLGIPIPTIVIIRIFLDILLGVALFVTSAELLEHSGAIVIVLILSVVGIGLLILTLFVGGASPIYLLNAVAEGTFYVSLIVLLTGAPTKRRIWTGILIFLLGVLALCVLMIPTALLEAQLGQKREIEKQQVISATRDAAIQATTVAEATVEVSAQATAESLSLLADKLDEQWGQATDMDYLVYSVGPAGMKLHTNPGSEQAVVARVPKGALLRWLEEEAKVNGETWLLVGTKEGEEGWTRKQLLKPYNAE